MIYLDNAATSFPKAPGVAEAVQKAMTEGTGNPGRASHAFARRSADIAYDTRELLAGFLGAPQAERLCFTKNATEALNIALLGWIKPGMTVITSELEHNAVMRPLRWLERYRDVRIRLFRCAGGGLPDLDEISKLLRDGSDLLVCTAASNVTGFKLPIEAIARLCAKGGVRCGLDGSQLVGHAPLNLAALDLDFFCFPGHKGLLGPMGTGGIYLKPGFDPMPLILGGTGSNSEREYMPGFYPDELEAGTPSNTCWPPACLPFRREKNILQTCWPAAWNTCRVCACMDTLRERRITIRLPSRWAATGSVFPDLHTGWIGKVWLFEWVYSARQPHTALWGQLAAAVPSVSRRAFSRQKTMSGLVFRFVSASWPARGRTLRRICRGDEPFDPARYGIWKDGRYGRCNRLDSPDPFFRLWGQAGTGHPGEGAVRAQSASLARPGNRLFRQRGCRPVSFG